MMPSRQGDFSVLTTRDCVKMLEGPVKEEIRWAKIEDIWKDPEYAAKFWKYLATHGVDDDLWKSGYDAFYAEKKEKPEALVKWNAHENL